MMAGVPISLDWPAFKGFVLTYGLAIDYAPQPTTPNYFVYSTDGNIDLECYITVSSDITDFETNFKAQATEVQIVPGPNISMVSVTNFPSVQPVSQSGIWTLQATFTGSTIGVTQVTSPWVCSISNFPATQTVNGTVSVGNFPATQTVAGTVTANQGTSPWVISAASLPLPAGAATASNQATANSSLATLVANSPPLGQALMAASVPVTIASNQSALAVAQSGVWNVTNITGAISLPTGASTSANQSTANTSLASIDSKTLTAGQKVMASSYPVVIASDQSALSVSQSGTWNINNVSGTISLPTGASTSALQNTGNASLASLVSAFVNTATSGQKVMASSFPVVVASDQSALSVTQSGTWNINNVSGTVSLPTGAATAANQATGNTSLASISSAFVNTATAGQKVMSASFPITIASDQSPLTTTLGNTLNKSVVMKTGTLVTTLTTAGQVVLTYTVTSGKTFFLEYFDLFAFVTALPGGASVNMGTFNLENPAGTALYSNTMISNGGGGVNPYFILEFAEPIPIISATVIRITVTPAAITSFTWTANFGGYER